MHNCLVYDCLFPWTVGGAERWYRNLGERLSAEGHRVTYLTMRQWDEPPAIAGIEVVAVCPRMALYRHGGRRILPPIVFGLGVLLHLLLRGRRYDVVHSASFPFFSMLAIGMCRPLGHYRIICDWHEVWSDHYWRDYLGRLGAVGAWVQRLCARVPQRAYAFSRLHAQRLRKLGLAEVTQLTGEYAGTDAGPLLPLPVDPPTILYAGRFIPEKRIDLLVAALPLVRDAIPDIRLRLLGDGPTRAPIVELIAQLGLEAIVDCPGFVRAEIIDQAMREALCVVQPSSREGYGMVVIEASARGVPAIVIAGEDNAATELVDEDRNGFVVAAPQTTRLAEAIIRCWREGEALRSRTRGWYQENEERLSLESSLRTVARDMDERAPTTA
ncbi:MAG: glycosyl transferase family 1 [Thermoleophilia bacterium]|nr:glycosyl transferase family 1 [Thermoleophilia bacterium]